MLEIKKANCSNLDALYKVHLNCIADLATSSELGAKTFLDRRTKAEISEILKEGESYVIMLKNVCVGYFLYKKLDEITFISKGIVVQNEVAGIGLQRLVHLLKSKDGNCQYVVSRYNTISLKNILALGLQVISEDNEIDMLYG